MQYFCEKVWVPSWLLVKGGGIVSAGTHHSFPWHLLTHTDHVTVPPEPGRRNPGLSRGLLSCSSSKMSLLSYQKSHPFFSYILEDVRFSVRQDKPLIHGQPGYNP